MSYNLIWTSNDGAVFRSASLNLGPIYPMVGWHVTGHLEHFSPLLEPIHNIRFEERWFSSNLLK